VAPLADADWASAWREHFRPVPVGRSLLITPPWETPAPGERVVLAIEPGRAFGTGHHGTTATCLELLESLVAAERPARALDLGTGSGILAIAAARLGVGEVLACDCDPDAIAAAEANAERNGVGDRVRAVVDDVATLAAPPAPLVLANLLAAAHRAFAERYTVLVAPGGVLVAGGLLDAEADEVAAVLAAHGFRREGARSLEGWTSLALRHAALHASA
jgi:ribosomal protein L11 methyltransferase